MSVLARYPLALTWAAALGIAAGVVQVAPGPAETVTTTAPAETIYVTLPRPEPREPPLPSPAPPSAPAAPDAPDAPSAPAAPGPVINGRPPTRPPAPPPPVKPPPPAPRPGKSETGKGCEHAPAGRNKFCR